MDSIIYTSLPLVFLPITLAIAFYIIARTMAKYPNKDNLAILKTLFRANQKNQEENKFLK